MNRRVLRSPPLSRLTIEVAAVTRRGCVMIRVVRRHGSALALGLEAKESRRVLRRSDQVSAAVMRAVFRAYTTIEVCRGHPPRDYMIPVAHEAGGRRLD